jgi:CRP/FNR family transcriptional regulator/CRP/FNR family cyclic AMP-dependent transcriptional regulator
MNLTNKIELLKLCPLFNSLTGRQLKAVAKHAHKQTYKEGRIIAEEGSTGNRFFIIADGIARVEQKKTYIRSMSQGGYFGEISLLDGRPRTANITAEIDVDVLYIRKSDFTALLNKTPDMKDKIIRALCTHLRKSEDTLNQLNEALGRHLGRM